MLDVDKLVLLYEDNWSLRDLAKEFGYQPRTIKAILKKRGVRIRSKRQSRKAYSKKTKQERIERIKEVEFIKDNRGNRANGPKVNRERDWIMINVARGVNSSLSLSKMDDCPYSSLTSLSHTLRRMKQEGLVEYITRGWRGITDISITEWGQQRVFEPSLAEEIIKMAELYPHLDYMDIATMLGCDRTYPRMVLSNK